MKTSRHLNSTSILSTLITTALATVTSKKQRAQITAFYYHGYILHPIIITLMYSFVAISFFAPIAMSSSLLHLPRMRRCDNVTRFSSSKAARAHGACFHVRHFLKDRQYLSRLHASNENKDDTSLQKSTAWQNSKSSIVDGLLQKTASRAIRTLTNTASGSWNDTDDTDINESKKTGAILNLVDAAIVRSSSTLSEAKNDDTANENQDKRTYLNNPCVTPTALAHSLWKSAIIPYQDSIIDATCGNGKDSLALARMLIPGEHDTNSSFHPHLIGIDIQPRAIANTQRSLLSALPDHIYYNHVTLLQRSHEHLLDVILAREDGKKQEVGLVCYNLGYLPGGQASNNNYKEWKTQTETTLNSITDAASILRVGGLLSVMTYPGSNLEESLAVEHFVEGLAMLTTRDEGGWRGYLASIPDYPSQEGFDGDADGRIRSVVTHSIERVAVLGSPKQTWRSFVHKPIGRPMSPILVTAHRIK